MKTPDSECSICRNLSCVCNESKIKCTCPRTRWYKCPIHSAVPQDTAKPMVASPYFIIDALIEIIRTNKKNIRTIIGDC